MSDVDKQYGMDQQFLYPQEIIIDPAYARPHYGTDDEENERIDKLSASIDERGQLDNGIVVPRVIDGVEHYVLLAGHRRRLAITRCNDRRASEGRPLLRMRVVVDRSGNDPLVTSWVSNLLRKGYSPMEFALLTEQVRKHISAKAGFSGSKQVAKVLNVDVATVHQHEKFLSASDTIKSALQSGQITAKAAFVLMSQTGNEKEQAALVQEARQEQVAEAREGAGKRRADKQAQVEENAEKGPIGEKAVKRAISKKAEASGKGSNLARSRNDIVGFFKKQDDDHMGAKDGVIRKFVRMLYGQFAPGSGTEKGLQKTWNDVAAAHVGDIEKNLAELTARRAKEKEAADAREAELKAKEKERKEAKKAKEKEASDRAKERAKKADKAAKKAPAKKAVKKAPAKKVVKKSASASK